MRPLVAVGMPLLFGVAVSGCATAPHQLARPAPGAVPAPLAIMQVGVEPKTLEAARQQVAMIRYELSQAASVVIELVDEEGGLVRRLTAGRQPAGRHAVTWDGQDDSGKPASTGVYRYVIWATGPDGRPVVYDPPETGGEELEVTTFTFHKETGRLEWVMPHAGYARVRVEIQGFPYLRTLLDWEPLEAGRHELVWDGLDASGLINVKGHPGLVVKLTAFAIPWNTIIVRGGASMPASRGEQTPYPPLLSQEAAYLHARHHRPICHEAGLRLEFPSVTRYDTEGRPVVSGVLPVRILLDEADVTPTVNSRFEVALYEDLTFLLEEEDAVHPFSVLWDTTRLRPGTHLLTANVFSYDDHYGVITQPVQVEAAR